MYFSGMCNTIKEMNILQRPVTTVTVSQSVDRSNKQIKNFFENEEQGEKILRQIFHLFFHALSPSRRLYYYLYNNTVV